MSKDSVGITVTNELCALEIKKNARFSFLSGVIRGTGELHFSLNGFVAEIKHENPNFIKLVAEIIGEIYSERPDIETMTINVGQEKQIFYSVFIVGIQAEDLLSKCKIVKNKYEFVTGIPKDFLSSNTARRAYLRGLFLSCGLLRVPSREIGADNKNSGYTLSFNLNSDRVKDDIIELLSKEALIDKSAVRQKKSGNGIYIKKSEAVCNVLTAMGSVKGALETYEIIATGQVLNNVNRVRNCDMANIDKTIRAVSIQLQAIEKLEKSEIFITLSDEMKETCRLRKAFPDLGIEQLGKEFKPPIGKSCLNHRLRKLVLLASELSTENDKKSSMDKESSTEKQK